MAVEACTSLSKAEIKMHIELINKDLMSDITILYQNDDKATVANININKCTNVKTLCDSSTSRKRKNENQANLNPNKKIGGGAVSKITLHIMVCTSFALTLLIVYKAFGFDQVKCFAWYSSIVRFNRTAAQNMYCDVLVNINQQFGQHLITMSSANNFAALFGAATSLVTAYSAAVAVVRKIHIQIKKIVDVLASPSINQAKITAVVTAAVTEAVQVINEKATEAAEAAKAADTANKADNNQAKTAKINTINKEISNTNSECENSSNDEAKGGKLKTKSSQKRRPTKPRACK